jgi:4-amino-4-deoxychorismate lyase
MCRLIESIKFLNGKFCNLRYHELRMKSALQNVFGADRDINLEKILRNHPVPAAGLFKCRILYDDQSTEISVKPYEPRVIHSLKVVEHNSISYAFKYEDRRTIDGLYQLRGNCDDILIIKNGLVTDSSYSNVVFARGREWVTPQSVLLKGTMRQKLIEDKQISEEQITVNDIGSFDKCKLINAMFAFDGPEIEVSRIVL